MNTGTYSSIRIRNPAFHHLPVCLCRLRNVILALAGNGTLLWDTSIMYGWEASTKYAVTELLSPDSMKDVALLTQQRMLMDIQ